MAAAGRPAARLPWAPGNPGCGGPGGCWRKKWPRRWQLLHRCIGPPGGKGRGLHPSVGHPWPFSGCRGLPLPAEVCHPVWEPLWVPRCPHFPGATRAGFRYELCCPPICHGIPQLWESHPVHPRPCWAVQGMLQTRASLHPSHCHTTAGFALGPCQAGSQRQRYLCSHGGLSAPGRPRGEWQPSGPLGTPPSQDTV